MVNNRVFQFSCDIFDGYKIIIDLDECNSMQDIINIAIKKLDDLLKKNSLNRLLEKRRGIYYHNHGNDTFANFLLNNTQNSDGVHGFICGHEILEVH